LTHFSHGLHDGFGLVHDHLGYAYLGLVHRAVHGRFDLGLYNVVDRKSKGSTGQGTRPSWISFGHGQGVQLAAVCGGRAQNDDDIVAARALDGPFDFLLTFQVNAACGRSHKAIGHLQDHFGTGAADAVSYARTRHPVPLA
jgi:hypothetical protein